MATFEELQKRISAAKFTKTVVDHLIEHLDENFRASAGENPKSVLLSDEKLPVPQDIFESVVTGFLVKKATELQQEIERVLQTPLNAPPDIPPPAHEVWSPQPPAQPQAAVLPFTPVPPAQAPVPAPVEQPRAPRTRSRT